MTAKEYFIVLMICQGLLIQGGLSMPMKIEQKPGQAPEGYVEIHGVAAGMFQPNYWKEGTLHFLPDYRHPLLQPQWTGVYRNIYAPSIQETRTGWRVFFGGWDGVPTGNDRIYSTETHNFMDFENRQRVIENGDFIHVCNVHVTNEGAPAATLVCTALVQDGNRLVNRPVIFTSTDGTTWNGSLAPHSAKLEDLIQVEGYDKFEDSDINGVNVLLKEGETYHLFFSSFTDWGHIYHATSHDRKHFEFKGEVLATPHMINDLRKFEAEGKTWYLMGLHQNNDKLWYSLSENLDQFPPLQQLAVHRNQQDRYIVAHGWVTRGNRVLGYLYGAGERKSLDRNRVFARWLQKKVVFVAKDGTQIEGEFSLGPDRQLLKVPLDKDLEGTLQVFDEDGRTPLSEAVQVNLTSTAMFQISGAPDESGFQSLLDPGLSQWEGQHGGSPEGWKVEGEQLLFSGKGPSICLKDKTWGDFILRLEYRLPPAGNSGVFIRFPEGATSVKDGMEIQILDDRHESHRGIQPWQHTGSIYGVVPPSFDPTKPAGEWNAMEVWCEGSRVLVIVNGVKVVDANVDDYLELRNRPKRGQILLQSHSTALEFKNLRIRRLD